MSTPDYEVFGGVKFAKLQYDRGTVNRAGKDLISAQGPVSLADRDRMLDVINNWRASHHFPLHCLKMTLLNRAKAVDRKAVVAQRLKRLVSIHAKLVDHSTWMKLTQMQDIGGCRAIVKNIRRLNMLIGAYQKGLAKNPSNRHSFEKENDYISEPKADGYRSHHFVYKYHSLSKKHRIYNGLKVEIQLRTRFQHAWATAVETVETFSGQPLKSGGGKDEWKRFFALMGSAIARKERCPIVPGTPKDYRELVSELREIDRKLNVTAVLIGWRTALKVIPSKAPPNAAMFLLEIDPQEWTLKHKGFSADDVIKASEATLEAEKRIAANVVPGAQVVLVQTSSLRALRTAFPNYHLDSTLFIEILHRIVPRATKSEEQNDET